MKIIKIMRGTAMAAALGISALAQATTPIQFNPNGTGTTGAVSVCYLRLDAQQHPRRERRASTGLRSVPNLWSCPKPSWGS